MTTGDRILIVALVAALAALTFIRAPDVNVAVPAAEVHISGDDIAESMAARRREFDPETGYFIALPDEADDPPRFRAACIDVCAQQTATMIRLSSRNDSELPEGRVLVNDPTTQNCTCFTGRHIVRYMAWSRQ